MMIADTNVSPFQGWNIQNAYPRAKPWAGMSRPLGANGTSECSSTNYWLGS